MKHIHLVLGCTLISGWLLATAQTNQLEPVAAKFACTGLVGLTIPASAIGLATSGATVLAATEVNDKDSAGQERSYCKTTGNILPIDPKASNIRFQVNLPKSWNQRLLQFGGGGTNGTVVTGLNAFSGAPANVPTPLARGYVTLGSDSGHSSEGKPPFDTSFALNREELMNFAQWQIKKTLDVAKFLSEKTYGQKPKLVYFIGGSQGGHEAFDAAQRYPDDYNGVVSHYPAFNVQNIWMGALAQAQAIYGNKLGVASPSWVNPAKVKTVVDFVRNQCDNLDGIVDGIISDVRGCNSKVNLETIKTNLLCSNNEDTGNACLSGKQFATIEKIASPVQFSFAFQGGSSTYPRWSILEGATFAGNEHLGKTNTADLAKTPFMPDGTAFQLFPAKGAVQGFVTGDLSYDPLSFDPNRFARRIQEVSRLTDAVSTDLKKFAAKGGKLLLTHGTIDDSITPHNTTNYWNKLVERNGQAQVAAFARYYLVPGQGHGSGIFRSNHNWLETLEKWVEQGTAPQNLVATDGNTTPATSATNGRSRPLCQYGSFPKFVGDNQSQANDSTQFKCTAY